MTRIKEISDKFFSRDPNVKTLTEFATEVLAVEGKIIQVGGNETSAENFKVNGEDVYQFLSDNGNGRIYDGLKSLETMSRIIRGVGEGLETLFDNKILSHTVDDMVAADIAGAVRIVNANLGLTEILVYARSKNVQQLKDFETFATRIAKDVKTGTFRTEPYLAEALLRIKSLIRILLKNA